MADRYVELKSVSKSYGGVPALTAVDFRCEPGRVHAILGENGAGRKISLFCSMVSSRVLGGQPSAFDASARTAAR